MNELQERFRCRVNVRRDLGVVEVSGGDVAAAEAEIRGIIERGVTSDFERDAGRPSSYAAAGGTPPRSSRPPPPPRGSPGLAPDDDNDDGFWDDDDDDDDWVLEGLEDELDDARRVAGWPRGRSG